MNHSSEGHSEAPPDTSVQNRQNIWYTIRSSVSADHLLEFAPDPRVRTHLLASTVKELDVWLDVLPISSLSLRMDDSTIRVAVGLRLGSPLCMPHKYHHCGAEVDS